MINKRIISGLFLFFILFVTAQCSQSQEQKPRFWDDIQKFKKQDSVQKPPANAILLIGSSSFTNWKDVQDYFKDYTIINRGFGGSTLPDQLIYVGDIIFPYKPKQIIIYCGENDLASNDSVTARMVLDRFVQLFIIIRSRLPQTHISYISMKPSPSRERLFDKMREGNTLIRNYLAKKERTTFIDVYSAMLDKDGKPIASIFLEDKLHMNGSGYVIWQRIMQPYLLK
jgi:lysophospholipase L1-like esterase